MPIESRIISPDNLYGEPKNQVKVGGQCIVASDYYAGEKRDLVVTCDSHDAGGQIFRIPHQVLAESHNGVTLEMRNKYRIGYIATLGMFPQIPISDETGNTKLLLLDHISDKFEVNQRTNRTQQVYT